MAVQAPTLIDLDSPSAVFRQDVLSEASLPLLNFLAHSNPDDSSKTLAENLHTRTIEAGKEEKPIPDESEQLESVLLQLIKDGVPKPEGKPKVSLQYQYLMHVLTKLGHYCRSRSFWPLRRLRTEESRLRSPHS